MEMNLQSEKLNLIKSVIRHTDPEAIHFPFNVAGVEVQFIVHGESKEDILDFFKYYFDHFPSLNKVPEQTIYFFSHPKGSGLSRHEHFYWNDPDEEFRISYQGEQKFIVQRDFAAIEDLKTRIIYATGPTLNQVCCDSTDNLVQFALGRHLIQNNILPLHAATVVVDDKAYVFYGESGAGKSTLAEQSYLLDHFKMMSGDQIFLKQTASQLMAYPNSTTIFGYHRTNPAWEHRPHPVAAIIHLLKAPRTYQYRKLPFIEAMPLILRETITWKEAADPDHLLDLILKIGENTYIRWGELSYKKGDSFWPQLLKEII